MVMAKLILLNDVSTELDEAELLVGNSDPPASKLGQSQADQINDYFWTKIDRVDFVFSSPAQRLLKLVHKLRVNSGDRNIGSLDNRQLECLEERSFGALNRTPVFLDSDLFSQTRITADQGESVYRCRTRLVKCIVDLCKKYMDKTVLAVSHPFACQIITNSVLQKDHTYLTKFWLEKGSFLVLICTRGRFGLRWEFSGAYNAISDISYTQDEIYSGLLGTKRTLSS
jgi:broad specificity phosphatase PhoE